MAHNTLKWSSILLLGLLYYAPIREEIVMEELTEEEPTPDENSDYQHKLSLHWDQIHLNTILERHAKESQVIMFGNTHADPRDAKFVASILGQLKQEGFDYLAIEGGTQLNKYIGTSELESECEKIHISCSHTMDLVEKAREYEVEVIFYDENTQIGNERDEIQFKNIRERIFKRDPDAKVVIYCGSGHAQKQPVKSDFLSPELIPLGMHLEGFLEGEVRTVLLKPEKGFMPQWLFDTYLDLGKGNPYCRKLYVDEVCIQDLAPN